MAGLCSDTIDREDKNNKKQGQYHEAVDYHKQAFDIYSELALDVDTGRKDIPDRLFQLGICHSHKKIGKYSEGEAYFKQALTVYRELSKGTDSKKMAQTLYNLGNSNKDMRRYREAECYYKKSISSL